MLLETVEDNGLRAIEKPANSGEETRQGAESDQAQLNSCSNDSTLRNPPMQTSLKQLFGFVSLEKGWFQTTV